MEFKLSKTVNGLHILRDDLLPGGTKRRALNILLGDIKSPRVAYAGTTMGHGALALALAAHDHRKKAHIFIATDDIDHPMIQKIQDAGAILHLEEPQPIASLHDLAKTWQSANDAHLFAPGFVGDDFHNALVKSLSSFNVTPYPEIWTCAVTGTLSRAIKDAFPHKTVKTVGVTKSTAADFTTPEKYHQPARIKPPYPSCPYTDSKIWQFLAGNAVQGALVWNTAG